MTFLEITANEAATVSILLAGRNSVHTWWIGIVGCGLFGVLFWSTQLYADAVLQAFFILASLVGWWHWMERNGLASHIRRTRKRALAWMATGAITFTIVYGTILHQFTDAYAPFADSAVLAVSVLAQLLLMGRRIETWPAWLLVNTITVPLYASRGLTLTAILYALYWINALVAWWHWSKNPDRIAAAA